MERMQWQRARREYGTEMISLGMRTSQLSAMRYGTTPSVVRTTELCNRVE